MIGLRDILWTDEFVAKTTSLYWDYLIYDKFSILRHSIFLLLINEIAIVDVP